MFFWIIAVFLLVGYILGEYFFLRKRRRELFQKFADLDKEQKKMEKDRSKLDLKIEKLDKKVNEVFFVYEVIKDFSQGFEYKRLRDNFIYKLKELKGVKEVYVGKQKDGDLSFALDNESGEYVNIKLSSNEVKKYCDILIYQYNLCVERIKLYNKMKHLSIFDSLTEIPNRRFFMRRFYEEFDRCKRFSLKLSLLMCDIDFFKKINDTYGHTVGDIVLREVARIIKERVREVDFVSRYGGEEFAVLLPETDKAAAIMVGSRLVRAVALERLRIFDEMLSVSISVGVASFPQNTFHSDMLIEIADKALYKAKQEGRNRVCWF